MRVLQVNKFYHPVVGGIERVVETIAEGLEARGHNVSVLAARKRGRGRSYERNGVEVHKVASAGQLLSVPIAPTFRLGVARLLSTADIVHYHLPNPLGVFSALLKPTTPSIATYHSDIVRQSTSLRFYRPLLDRFLAQVDRILVTSPRLCDNSAILQSYQDKCTVVPLSIDVDAYDSSGMPSCELPITDEDDVVLFVGRLNYYKGVEYLIGAMKQVDAQLLIVGDGERRDRLEQLVDEYNIADRIHFLQHVSDERLHACYERADLFVLPSVEPSEAFGLVQLEAMIHGTPVVNTDLPTGVPWVSIDSETGLTVPPRDATTLADAISTLLGDEQLRERLGNSARQRVKMHFNRKKMLDQIESVYEDIRR